MLPTVADLLAKRHRVSDSALIDWADLALMLEPPCFVKTAALMERWQCTQPTVSRRLNRLWDADLIDYRVRGRALYIRRIGPPL